MNFLCKSALPRQFLFHHLADDAAFGAEARCLIRFASLFTIRYVDAETSEYPAHPE